MGSSVPRNCPLHSPYSERNLNVDEVDVWNFEVQPASYCTFDENSSKGCAANKQVKSVQFLNLKSDVVRFAMCYGQ